MKYIVELKEPAWRRALRYALWTLLIGGLGGGLLWAALTAINNISHTQLQQSTALLTELAPLQAQVAAQRVYRQYPTPQNLRIFIHSALKADNFDLAQYLVSLPQFSITTLADWSLWAITTHHRSPTVAIDPPSLAPIDDEDRLAIARAAITINTPQLRQLALSSLRQLHTPALQSRARLMVAQLSYLQGDPAKATELARLSITDNLVPSDAITLLALCDTLALPEAADYRSALRLRARHSPAMAVRLATYLATHQPPASVAAWLSGLPTGVGDHPQAQILSAILCARGDSTARAIPRLPSAELTQVCSAIISGTQFSLQGLSPDDLLLAIQLSSGLSRPTVSLWSAYHALDTSSIVGAQGLATSALAAGDDAAIISSYTALDTALGGSLLARSQVAYRQLLLSSIDTPTARAAYTTLRDALARYPSHSFIQSAYALSLYRVGNLTDALLALPSTRTTSSDHLVAAYLLSLAGQRDSSGAALAMVSQDTLSTAERLLFSSTAQTIQSQAPLQRLLDVLRQN